MKKILGKNSKIVSFWLSKMWYTSKKSSQKLLFIYEIKSEVFVMKKLKKNQFCDFQSPKILTFYRSWLNFWKTCQDSQKMTLLPSSWDVFGKVKNFCDHSMTLREMTNNLLTTGHFWTTPASLRVNILLHTQSILCARVDSQCLEYLGCITLGVSWSPFLYRLAFVGIIP